MPETADIEVSLNLQIIWAAKVVYSPHSCLLLEMILALLFGPFQLGMIIGNVIKLRFYFKIEVRKQSFFLCLSMITPPKF